MPTQLPNALSRVLVACYRTFLREARGLKQNNRTLVLYEPMDIRSWGRGGYLPEGHGITIQKLLFPGVRFDTVAGLEGKTSFSGEDLERIVRSEFRRKDAPSTAAAADVALRHVATLGAVKNAASSCTRTVTPFGHLGIDSATATAGDDKDTSSSSSPSSQEDKVEVEVCTAFVPSLPLEEMVGMRHFPHTYRVRVTNLSRETVVQLLSRHWIFTDDESSVVVVPKGSAGVVGQTPVIMPGQSFQYTSGTNLATPSGRMEGSFRMTTRPISVTTATPIRLFDAAIGSTRLRGPDAEVRELLATLREQAKTTNSSAGDGAGDGGDLGGGGPLD